MYTTDPHQRRKFTPMGRSILIPPWEKPMSTYSKSQQSGIMLLNVQKQWFWWSNHQNKSWHLAKRTFCELIHTIQFNLFTYIEHTKQTVFVDVLLSHFAFTNVGFRWPFQHFPISTQASCSLSSTGQLCMYRQRDLLVGLIMYRRCFVASLSVRVKSRRDMTMAVSLFSELAWKEVEERLRGLKGYSTPPYRTPLPYLSDTQCAKYSKSFM